MYFTENEGDKLEYMKVTCGKCSGRQNHCPSLLTLKTVRYPFSQTASSLKNASCVLFYWSSLKNGLLDRDYTLSPFVSSFVPRFPTSKSTRTSMQSTWSPSSTPCQTPKMCPCIRGLHAKLCPRPAPASLPLCLEQITSASLSML